MSLRYGQWLGRWDFVGKTDLNLGIIGVGYVLSGYHHCREKYHEFQLPDGSIGLGEQVPNI